MNELVKWAKDRAVEEGECWTWQMSFSDGQRPQGSYKGKNLNVRRELLQDKLGKPLRRDLIVGCTCDNHACVNPAHLKATTRSARLSGIQKTPAHCAKVANTKRRASRLTDEAVAEIRNGPGTQKEKAEKFGIDRRYVQMLQKHRCWKDYSSPFAGLGAMNDSTNRRAA